MSLEDTNYLKELTSGRKSSSSRDDESRSNRRRDEVRSSRLDASSTTARDASRSVVSVSKPKRSSDFDWFEFFLNAGCDVDHCTRYARNAESEGFDADLIPDFEEGNLRSLGLKEGDVVRVKRFIREKYAPAVPNKDKDRQAAADREAQIAADALLAQKLSRGEPLPPAPQLFSSGPDGTLKPRRGRRNTAASSNSVNTSALASAASELEKNRSSSPAVARVSSPPVSAEPSQRAASSTQPAAPSGGFDDDAWDVKPAAGSAAANPTSPPPAPSPVAAAPTPPPAPPAAPNPPSATAPAVSNLLAQPQAVSPPPAEPKRTDSNQGGLTYNDGLLAGMGIAANANRSSSVPIPSQPTGSSSSFLTPQGTGFNNNPNSNPNGPRGPVPPTAANQNLLAPLQPMRTGFATMGGGMQPQMTGFGQAGANPFGDPFAVPGLNAQMTGFNGSMGMQQQHPMMTGFNASMMSRAFFFPGPRPDCLCIRAIKRTLTHQICSSSVQNRADGFLKSHVDATDWVHVATLAHVATDFVHAATANRVCPVGAATDWVRFVWVHEPTTPTGGADPIQPDASIVAVAGAVADEHGRVEFGESQRADERVCGDEGRNVRERVDSSPAPEL